jgi:hypothetical protein
LLRVDGTPTKGAQAVFLLNDDSVLMALLANSPEGVLGSEPRRLLAPISPNLDVEEGENAQAADHCESDDQQQNHCSVLQD